MSEKVMKKINRLAKKQTVGKHEGTTIHEKRGLKKQYKPKPCSFKHLD